MEVRGILDSMRRVLGYTSKIFRYAMVRELADRDPTIGLADALERPVEGHYAAITDPVELGALLRAIDGYNGQPACRAALKLAPLLFQRPGELRRMEWAELDLEVGEWRIASAKMKTNNDHIVPLPIQAIEILKRLHPITGNGKWVFPSTRGGERPMSDNTINAALKALGYGSDVMVGHGFRATARTILDEVLAERVDFIEHQLAHAVKDPNGRAYNRTAHLPARREMMQRWADYLDTLRAVTRGRASPAQASAINEGCPAKPGRPRHVTR
jgi:integrase